MQDSIEIQAATLDEAKSKAANQFGVSADQLDITVLEESKGLFGKGSIRISATIREQASAPVEKPKRSSGGTKSEKPKAAPKKAVVEDIPVEANEDAPADTTREQVTATQEDADEIVSIVNEMLEAGDLEASVHAAGLNGRYINLELDGKDAAYLIGKHGEILNAMQYLLNVIVTKQLENGTRITLDGGNYRRKREEALENLAVRIAEQVRDRGEEAVLDALPAFERRVVHKALSEFDGISTYSEGEEPNRRVVIAPAE